MTPPTSEELNAVLSEYGITDEGDYRNKRDLSNELRLASVIVKLRRGESRSQTGAIKIEVGPEPFKVEVKRFYVPVKITAECPECGKEVTKDCESDYLSHPTFNAVEQVHFYCVTETDDDHEEHEFYAAVRFGITAVAIDAPPVKA